MVKDKEQNKREANMATIVSVTYSTDDDKNCLNLREISTLDSNVSTNGKAGVQIVTKLQKYHDVIVVPNGG